MNIKNKKDKIYTLIISCILFANMILENAQYLKFVYAIVFVSVIYMLNKILKNKNLFREIFLYKFFWWFLSVFMVVFIYGFFGKYQESYSLPFHFLNFIWMFITYVLLLDKKDSVIQQIVKVNKLVVLFMSIYIFVNDFEAIKNLLLNGTNSIIGVTLAGNQNHTAICLVFLLIPLFWELIVEKDKKNLLITFFGAFIVILTASKKGIISLILIFLILYLVPYLRNTKIISRVIKISVLFVVIGLLFYKIPVLHDLIWVRLESMLFALGHNVVDESSTALRKQFIKLAFTHAWDKPLFGHGWGSFAMTYGYIRAHNIYMYTHSNFAEILFSFGLFGFLLYYSYPLTLLLKTIRIKDVKVKSLCLTYIAVLLFIDTACVTCYDSIVAYLGFAIVSIIINNEMKKLKLSKTIIEEE